MEERMPGTIRALALAGVAALAAGCAAQAQDKTLYVAGYGGSFELTIRKEIVPAFEKKFAAKVEYIAGNSTDTVAKLQAQRGNPQIDVAIGHHGPTHPTIRPGLGRPAARLS